MTVITLPTAAENHAGRCAACDAALSPGQPVAWTIGRRRIHETCIAASRLREIGRRRITSTEAAQVIADRRRCAACFAIDTRISLAEARRLMMLAADVPGVRLLPMICSSCGRQESIVCDMRSGAAIPAE
jgi:hypothetical protein